MRVVFRMEMEGTSLGSCHAITKSMLKVKTHGLISWDDDQVFWRRILKDKTRAGFINLTHGSLTWTEQNDAHQAVENPRGFWSVWAGARLGPVLVLGRLYLIKTCA